LVEEADKFKDSDEKAKKKIEASNALENYTYSVRNSLNDTKLKEKFTSDEKENVQKTLDRIN